MKAIVTVIGKDKVGIVAGVLNEFFTMMAVVSSEEKQDFTALREELNELGEKLKVKINIQSSAIFDAMHNI